MKSKTLGCHLRSGMVAAVPCCGTRACVATRLPGLPACLARTVSVLALPAFARAGKCRLVDFGAIECESSEVVSINGSHQVIGHLHRSGRDMEAFIWTADGLTQGFVWTAGEGMHPLGSLGGGFCRALAINKSGTIAGNASTESGQIHACLWQPAGSDTYASLSQRR